jgi:cell growth-regulating nucleolar protein
MSGRKCFNISHFSLCSTDDYRAHVSCVSEAERYEKTVYKGNKKNAKKNPQEAWKDLITEASDSAPPALQAYMQRLAELDNVPRKEKPFRNWAANSLNLRGQQTTTVESLWKFLSELRAKDQASRNMADNDEKRGDVGSLVVNQIDDVSKTEREKIETISALGVCDSTDLSSKSIRKTLKKVLKKAPNRSMKIKALRTAIEDQLGIEKTMRKKLKALLSQEIQVDTEKIVVDGKVVTLK